MLFGIAGIMRNRTNISQFGYKTTLVVQNLFVFNQVSQGYLSNNVTEVGRIISFGDIAELKLLKLLLILIP